MVGRTLRLLAALLGVSGTAAAQAGSIAGRVTEQGGGPIANARIQVLAGGATIAAGTTNETGQYRIANVRAGAVGVVASRIGYSAKRSDVVVPAGGTVQADFTLSPVATALNALVTTTTRGAEPEKILDSPNSISVVSAERIAERPAVTVTDNLKSQPGLSISNGGLVQANIVSRGFNNAFSGSMLMLQDYRFAGVPSLRVNVPFLFTGTQDDVDRIEVLQGPASALYGPNSANGVLHVITKSPFQSKGTTLTVDGGERSLLRAGIRHAGTLGSKFGYKVSGEYFTGRDFEYRDPNEPVRYSATDTRVPASRRGQPLARNFDLEKRSGEVRLDYRPSENTELITTAGYSMIGSGLEITTTFGASQIQNWSYSNFQQRFRHKKFFAQAFYNASNAGNENAQDATGTYYLRTGIPVVDKSNVLVGQMQQGFDVGKTKFVAGVDYIATRPRSAGTIFGRNEGATDITETGGYLQATTKLTPRVELLTAVRGDQNTRLEGWQFSPRAALTWKAAENHSFRATFNRAFNSPASFSFFLDQFSGTTVLPGMDVQIFGNPAKQGWQYARSCNSAVESGLCMRSIFTQPGLQPASPAAAWPGVMQALGPQIVASLPAALQPTILGLLRGAQPTQAQLGTGYIDLNTRTPTTNAAAIRDYSPLAANFSNTYELGYKGVFKERLRVALDLWYQIRPADPTTQIVNPMIAPDGARTGAYLQGLLGPTLTQLAQAGLVTPAQITQIITGLTTGIAGIPFGAAAFTNPLYDKPYFVFSYQNATGQVDVRGLDFAADYLIDDKWSVAGTYSHLGRNLFPFAPGATVANPLAANTPRHRASTTVRYENAAKGFSTEVRGRYADAMQVNSGVFNSLGIGAGQQRYPAVPVNAFLDLGFSWKLPFTTGVRWAVNAQNILNNEVASFVGVPAVGRLVTTRFQYAF